MYGDGISMSEIGLKDIIESATELKDENAYVFRYNTDSIGFENFKQIYKHLSLVINKKIIFIPDDLTLEDMGLDSLYRIRNRINHLIYDLEQEV